MLARGCLYGLGGVGPALVLAAAWAVFYLVYGPSGGGGFLVSEQEQTYLQAETGLHGEGFLDPYESLDIYFTQASGWFESPTRKLVYQQMTAQYEHAPTSEVQFVRYGDKPSDPIVAELRGEQILTFTPPAHFADYRAIR